METTRFPSPQQMTNDTTDNDPDPDRIEQANFHVEQASQHLDAALQNLDAYGESSLGLDLCNVALTAIGAYLSTRAETGDDEEKSPDA